VKKDEVKVHTSSFLPAASARGSVSDSSLRHCRKASNDSVQNDGGFYDALRDERIGNKKQRRPARSGTALEIDLRRFDARR